MLAQNYGSPRSFHSLAMIERQRSARLASERNGLSLREIRKDFVAIHTNNAQKTQTLESTFEKVDSSDNAHFLSLRAVLAPRGKVWLLVSFGTLTTAASSTQAQKC